MTESALDNAQLLSMLDGIEEAIGADVTWSDLPPALEAEVVSAALATESPPRVSGTRPKIDVTTAPFAGLSSELRRYPDAAPRRAGTGPRVRGSTSAVLASFNWGPPARGDSDGFGT